MLRGPVAAEHHDDHQDHQGHADQREHPNPSRHPRPVDRGWRMSDDGLPGVDVLPVWPGWLALPVAHRATVRCTSSLQQDTVSTDLVELYRVGMPRLWDQSVRTHRQTVHDAVLDAAAALIERRGLASVTMAGIAGEAGIGRATLYKYFPDVDAVLAGWHRRHVEEHLARLREARDRAEGPVQQLEVVLHAYAALSGQQAGGEIAAALHRAPHIEGVRAQLRSLLTELMAGAAEQGAARRDVPAEELALFAEHALAAARELDSDAALGRLVRLTLSGAQGPG
jgi:AcrR family transcriptional regulator